jgi:hypothetical protein
LVIAGTGLSKRGGLQLCKDIKSNENCSSIPFVLLRGIFDEVTDQDRERVHADGVITKPLQGEEILRLVEKLTAEGTMKKKKESLLSELDRLDDEEIIELVDVVEEPESKVSISDLMAPEKEDLLGDITPLETWEKPFREETKPLEAKGKLVKKEGQPLDIWERPSKKEQKPPEDELTLSFEEEAQKKVEEINLQLRKEGPLEDDLFEKVDFEDILQKVEDIKPSAPKEIVEAKTAEVSQGKPSMKEESSERFFSLEEFETALLKGVKSEPLEQDAPSLHREGPKAEARSEIPPLEMPRTEKAAKPAAPGGGFESFFAEEPNVEARVEIPPREAPRLEKAASSALLQEDLQSFFTEESLEEIPTSLASSELPLEEEALKELPEEEFPAVLLEEELEEGDVSIIEMPKEEKMGVMEKVQAPSLPKEEIVPVVARPDKLAEELITKGIQTMMEDFVKKVVPEIAQNIVSLTMERIEQMVKEMVPDLAQKAIQEEIKRLQMGEKE